MPSKAASLAACCAQPADPSHAVRVPRPPPLLLQGYARVPRYDGDAVREALYSRGPLAMSFDASRPSFTFYSSGVYAETEASVCPHAPAALDMAWRGDAMAVVLLPVWEASAHCAPALAPHVLLPSLALRATPDHPQCAYKPDQLDHSMLLVGYGTDAAGDYWCVRCCRGLHF